MEQSTEVLAIYGILPTILSGRAADKLIHVSTPHNAMVEFSKDPKLNCFQIQFNWLKMSCHS